MPPGPAKVVRHVPQVRAVVLTDYVRVAESLGLEPYGLLRECGIDPRHLENSEIRLPARAATRLIEESARISGCEAFGLLLTEGRSFASLGPLSLLLRHERTLGGVLARFGEYRRLVSDVFELDVTTDGPEAQLRIGLSPDIASRQGIELTMALTCQFVKAAMFGGWYPAAAHFRHPPPADPGVHQRVFRCSLRFDSSFNGFVFPAASLERENAYADPGFLRHARDYVERLAEELPELSLIEQVRSAIRMLLPTGSAGLEKVARHMQMHPRALQRMLTTEGMMFTQLVETEREQVAGDLLTNTDLPIAEVAALAGYASPTSFSRWFAARLGAPPNEWRRRNRPAKE